MKPHIVLITNSCPFYGEVFLRNELDHIPENQTVTLFPIFLNGKADSSDFSRSNIEIVTAGSTPSVWNRLCAGLYSPIALLRYGELPAIFKRKQPLRNLLKALKFAYLGESRAQAIRQWLLRHHQDEPPVFYSYWFYEAAYTAARLRQMHPGSRFVSRCHGYDLYEIRHPNGYLPFRSFLLRQVDQLHAISEDGKRYLEDRYADVCRLRISRLGTTDHGLNPTGDGDVITLVSCSNLVEVKRVDRIIDALKLCDRKIRWFHFGDGPLRQTLEEKARSLPSHIQWQFQGSVPNAELMEFYRATPVDAFLNVSESEGVPVSIMEALSFGIPAIATDVGGTHEIVIDRHNGILLDPQFRSSALAEAITQLPGNPKYRENARAIWIQTCDAASNYKKFYQEITQTAL